MRAKSIVAVVLGLALSSSAIQAQDESRFAGTWKGDLQAGAKKLAFVFHLKQDEDGDLTGTLDSQDEGLFDLAINDVSVLDGGKALIHLASVGAIYEVTLADDDQTLDGTWKQRGVEIPLRCVKGEVEKLERVTGQEKLAGIWEGKLDVEGQELRIVFKLKEHDNGRLVGSVDSPDQGAFGLLINKIEIGEKESVTLVLAMGATYEGKLDSAATKLDGAWKQGGASLPLTLSRVDKPSERKRPQTPKPPFPYRAIDVSFPNARDAITLAGTLTLPDGDGPFPVAILITGSGPQDRDETILDHKPFLVIADALTRRGVAVLRVDDRGVGKSTGSLSMSDSTDLATDVEAGLDFLKTRAEIDPKRIGLIGHSEGGLLAPMVAATRDDVAFVVLLAGPGVNGEQILYAQQALLARAAGANDALIAANRAVSEKLFAVARDRSLMRNEAAEQMREIVAAMGEEARNGGDAAATAVAAETVAQIDTLVTPWMRLFLVYEPAPALEKMRCPVLAVIGEKDLQVPAEQNIAPIRAAFERGKNPDATVEVLTGLNHLFQKCETGGVGEYAEIETTFDDSALLRICDWVVEHTHR